MFRHSLGPPVDNPILQAPPAGLEPAASGLRARRHLPFDHEGVKPELRRQGSNLRLTINSRASCRLDHTGMSGGSRIRTCGRSPAYALAPRCLEPLGHASEAEGEGVEPPRPRSPPVFETGYRTHGSPSERVAPAGVEPAPHRLRVGGSASLSYEAEGVTGRDRTCGASRFRRALYR